MRFNVGDRVYSLLHSEWGVIVKYVYGDSIVDFGKEIFDEFGSPITECFINITNNNDEHYSAISNVFLLNEEDIWKKNIAIGDIVTVDGELGLVVDVSTSDGYCRALYTNGARLHSKSFYITGISKIEYAHDCEYNLKESFFDDLITSANYEVRKGNMSCARTLFDFLKNCYPQTLESFTDTMICSVCGKIMLKSSYRDEENNPICGDCFEREFTQCGCCQSLVKKENANNITREGYFLCSKCNKREFVLPYHRYYPQIEFFGKKNKSMPYLGVELEIAEGGERNSEAKKVVNILNKESCFAYCSHDSSIDNGFEIITQPATLEYHNSIKHIYKSLFETLLEDGYVSHDNSTCGLHVHFNRNFFEDNEELYITRLLYLVDKFWDNIVIISRRNKRKMTYTKKIDMPLQRYIERANKTGCHDYHYYAINLINNNTIEFRMFRGTLNINTFLATLQFVNNCILCAKTKTAQEIQSMTFEELITGKSLKTYWKSRANTPSSEY